MIEKVPTAKPQQYSRKKIEAYSYGLNDEIGKGYSSRVYCGRHDQTEQQVAVKVIDLKMLKNDINRELLYSEIEALKDLRDCSHVLHLCDIFSTRNNTYIITELCASDLSVGIKNGLSHSQALTLIPHIINGYLQFQAKHIVHRDLKPANILLTHGGHVRIADFGFAIRAEALSKGSKYNVGSPLYMAPESLRKNEYSYRSDIWALGVIFYQMLFADTPWRAKNQKDLLKKIQNEPIESVIANKPVSGQSKQFLLRCLRVDKHSRMGPQELQMFSFNNCQVLGEKNLNIAHKSNGVNQSLILGSPLETISKDLKMECSVQEFPVRKGKAYNQNIENGSGHIKLKTVQVDVLRVEGLSRDQKKLISKMLISEVHFCRFLYKLLQKIKESKKLGLLKGAQKQEIQRIHASYAAVIQQKIDKLLAFKDHNFLKCEGHLEYRWTSDCDKLIKIAKEYNDRYKADLQNHQEGESNAVTLLDPTNRLIIVLYDLLRQQVAGMPRPQEEITKISREVVILDYLVTAQQLLEMIAVNPEAYQRFARKSRIEEIVEGKTVDIHYELYTQIMERVRNIMQRPQFISFGTEHNV